MEKLVKRFHKNQLAIGKNLFSKFPALNRLSFTSSVIQKIIFGVETWSLQPHDSPEVAIQEMKWNLAFLSSDIS